MKEPLKKGLRAGVHLLTDTTRLATRVTTDVAAAAAVQVAAAEINTGAAVGLGTVGGLYGGLPGAVLGASAAPMATATVTGLVVNPVGRKISQVVNTGVDKTLGVVDSAVDWLTEPKPEKKLNLTHEDTNEQVFERVKKDIYAVSGMGDDTFDAPDTPGESPMEPPPTDTGEPLSEHSPRRNDTVSNQPPESEKVQAPAYYNDLGHFRAMNWSVRGGSQEDLVLSSRKNFVNSRNRTLNYI